ncbi:MAG: CDC48 family AAA ATPase [Candidatus Lokiarchaeota archaeon]|nr:CDC48 family AAA ATPase [Candidatus Harpocratesius repetitus]
MAMSDMASTEDDRPMKTLRVEEIAKSSAGRFMCRMDTSVIRELGLTPGEIIEIIGKKTTAAILFPSSESQKEIIRIDGLTRRNAGVGIGEYVKVRKCYYKIANKVVLSLIQSDLKLSSTTHQIKLNLLNKPLKIGDIINISGSNLAKKESGEGPYKELREMMPFLKTPTVSIGEVKFAVVETNPKGIVQVQNSTKIEIKEGFVATNSMGEITTYDDIGGLGDEIQRVREMVELPLKHPELFHRVNIDPPKGVLLHGPPGTGKTLMARAVSQEANATFITINGPEIMSKFYGASEERLRKIFKEAEDKAPTIIFIDEIDSIAPKRENVSGEVERRVVAQLLSLMDGLKGRGRIIVIGATNRVNSIDEALRRPGRFDREIELKVPDQEGRKEIFLIHTRGMPLHEDVDLNEYARQTHGFVGADIMAVAREAAISSLRKILPNIDLDKPIPPEILESLRITDDDFQSALTMVEPSAMREVMIEVPDIKWEEVGGLDSVKQELKESIEWPLKYPHLYKKAGIRAVNGVLLFGPPGCGKTMLAKAVATESELNFLTVKGPEIFSKWVGESEKAIREIFRKARLSAPSIIYFDEIDAIAANRGGGMGSSGSNVGMQVVNQILVEMDGIEDRKGVIVVASTNRPDILDPALLRPGRFDRLIYVPAPDLKSRIKILDVHTKNMPLSEEAKANLHSIAERTELYSGADLENVIREAGMQAIREKLEDFETIEYSHLEFALSKIAASLTPDLIQKYNEISETLSRQRIRAAAPFKEPGLFS